MNIALCQNYLFLYYFKYWINFKKETSQKCMKITHTLNAHAMQNTKGHLCSKSGHEYEKKIHNIVQHCYIDETQFNTQKVEELGQSSSKNDIECNYLGINNVGIEIKKYNTPDWMQCSIKYNTKNQKWEGSKKCKIPTKSRDLFNTLINSINLYDGDVPPFMTQPITHDEWLKIKKETNKWDDKYIDVPSNTISQLYLAKECYYIQISDGYGLYCLKDDVCGFNVPLFNPEQQLRIRTKIHTKKNKKGYCHLSVTVACQPKNIKNLVPSNYSLDNVDKLPLRLRYDNNFR